MNVCNKGSSIVVFTEPPRARLTSDSKAGSGACREWPEHCRLREFAERAAAKRATCSRAREVHQELAQAYARMAQTRTSNE